MPETPFWRRYQRLFESDREADAKDEVETHIALRVEDLIRQGRTEGEARAQAAREFGDVARIRREMNEIGRKRRQRELRARWWGSLGQDIRYAFRLFRASPGFASVVVLTLALGIGGTTAVFSVFQRVLRVPLPYEQPGQLVRFYQQEPDKPDSRSVLAGTHFTFLRDHAASFEHVAALYTYSETGLDLVGEGRGQRLRVLPVTSDYFGTLRSGSLRGSGFDLDDERGPEGFIGTRKVVLSDRLWRTRFGSDASLIGSTIRLSAEPYEVVGIAPREFDDPIAGEVDAWVPYDLAGDTYEENNSLTAVGRLRNGISLEQARAELAALSPAMKERWPAARRSAIVALPLQEDIVAPARGPLGMLLAAVGLVLLVACANVANLVVVRAAARMPEFAIRSALGSGRGRLARQLLVESLLLAGCGGLLGLALAGIGIKLLQDIGIAALPRFDEVGFDPVILGFTVGTTMVTAIVFGVAPALFLVRISPNRALRQQSRAATSARAQGWFRNGLATAQLALALTLLFGAALLVASLHRVQQVELGFRAERLLTLDVNLPAVRYDAERRAAFQEEMARAIQTIPGITAAGGISRLPATGSFHPWNTFIRSGPLAGTSVTGADGFHMQQRVVSGDVFAALEIPVLAGRTFDARDDASAPLRALVSANFARRAFPGMAFDGVVGQRIKAGGRELEIIGVVGDVALDVYGTPTLVVYHAHRQFADDRNWALTQVVAAERPPERTLAAVREQVAALDPELVVDRAAPMTEVIGRGTSREQFALVLMGAFAAVALMLAALGLYGVLAYTVRQRTQEIGIRMALGATVTHVRTLVLRQAAIVVGLGLVMGIAGAFALGRWLSSLVFETSPSDLRILAAIVVLLTITALLSAWLPMRRASQVEPRIAMQES